jgi:hypothetical protein
MPEIETHIQTIIAECQKFIDTAKTKKAKDLYSAQQSMAIRILNDIKKKP